MTCGYDATVLLDQIGQYVRETFLLDASAELRNDTSLLGEGIIDSTGVLELVMYLEETFHIEVADEEIVPENFDSIDALCAYVQRKPAR